MRLLKDKAARAARIATVLFLATLAAGCVRAPSEQARRVAIADHVLEAEDYPAQFVKADAFAFRNLQRVPDAEPVQFAVDADFDVVYTAEGKVIVDALRAEARADREKQKRRANSVVEKLTNALGNALESAQYEQRFEDVKAGDKDHYAGHFVLARNEDGSWRVVDADYR
jgi:hypothetical protein